MSRRHLSEDEHALWAAVARSVAPLGKAGAKKKPAAATGKAAPASPRLAAKAETPPLARALAQPPPLLALERRLKQRVARGSHAIAARLDLHGMTQQEARAALAVFLSRAQADGAKMVLVVTGKGSGQSAPPGGERGVLRRQVPLWLALPEFRRFVVGFDEAHRSHGGQGALYVRLRRPR